MFSDNKSSIDSNLAIIYAETDVNVTETVAVIKVETDRSVTDTVFNIRSVVNFFHEGVTLYNSGNIYVLTDIGSEVRRHIQDSLLVRQIQIANNEDLSNTYTKFVAFHDQNGQVRILPRNVDTGFAFKHVQEIISRSSANRSVVVSLKDIFRLARKPKEHRQVSLARNKSSVKAGHKKVSLPTDLFVITPADRTDFLKQPISHPTDDRSDSLNRHQSRVQEENVEHNLVLNTELYFDNQPLLQFDTREHGSVQQDNMSLYSRQSFLSRSNTWTPRQNQLSSASRRSENQEAYRMGQQPGLTSQNTLVTSRSTFPSNDGARNVSSNTPIVPSRYPDYVDNDVRLASFERWIRRNPNPSQLATAGFFFTNQSDLVRCFQCGIGLKDFSEEDDPLLEHVRHSGQCPFLPKVLGYERLNFLKAQLEATDPDYNRLTQWNGGQGNFPSRSYRHPEYRSHAARLATFTRWPSNMTQRPAQLAEAGLYYTGEEDLVRCFACDGGLRRWDPSDDPWTEHCRWFPACPYCIEQKGEEYIALVQASVDQQELNASGGDMINNMEQLRITEAKVQSFYSAHKEIFTDMGFKEADVKEAIKELHSRGCKTYEIEEIVELIAVIKERSELETSSKDRQKRETPLEENRRLRRTLTCNRCHEKPVNALLLPCTHHLLCMECAEHLSACPRCNRPIREKIKTFMG